VVLKTKVRPKVTTHNGTVAKLSNMDHRIMDRHNNSITLSNHLCNNPKRRPCNHRTTIPTTPLRPTDSSHSMVHNNHRNHFKTLNLLLMGTVSPLTNHLMEVLHNSGRVHLKTDHLSIIIVVVAVFLMLVEVMKHLSWVLLFVWDLTTSVEVIRLKRAMASPISIQITIKLRLLPFLSQIIKAIRHRILDSVHLLILTPTTLLNEVEET
jgi:hypothetical protein